MVKQYEAAGKTEAGPLPDYYGDEAGKKWYLGSLSQLIVLASGLILTVAVYVTLGFFVQGTLKEEYDRVLTDSRQVVSENLIDLGRSIRTISILIALSKGDDKESQRNSILATVPDVKKFDRVFWLERTGNDQWQIHDIYKSKRVQALAPILSPGSEEKLPEYILLNKASDTDLIVISDLPGTRYEVEVVEPMIKTQDFVMAHPVSSADPGQGIVVGVGRVTNVINRDWLENRPAIQSLVVRDMDTGRRLYYMDRNYERAQRESAIKADKQEVLSIGQANWQVLVTVGLDNRMGFLRRTPSFFLFFGIILTLVGTMYVRNNQKQSFRLLAMNRTLAQKNYDLNTEMAERERLNHSLRKAEREYRAIVDAISDIIFEVSTEGSILFLNETWRRITGFANEEAAGKNLFDFLHPQDRAEQLESFGLMIKGQKHAYRAFTRLKTASGGYRSVELAISMLRQDENHNLRVVGSLTDIEERQRAQKALSEAEKKYREIVENAAGGIYQVTPEGQFLSANPAMARILGYKKPDDLIENVRDAQNELYEDPKERMKFLRELEPGGPARHAELRVMTADGRKIWVIENVRAVGDDEGNAAYYEGSMEDVTQRKEVEIKLREAKIQSDLANRAKSEFLANMSHELRTPLNAIIGFSEIIKNEVLGRLDNDHYRDYITDIYESGNRLLTIINEILDVSHIEAGERQLNESLVSISKVAASCVDFMTAKAKANNLDISNLIDETAPEVIGEELAMKQILLNLLSNAIKFTPEEGRITISYEVDKAGELRLSVTDTGVGLDEIEIEKALSPFGQLETSLHRGSNSGVGLGLTLVDSLIKLHGGRLELFSQKGIGTTATIVFPSRRVSRNGAKAQDSGENEDASPHPESIDSPAASHA